MTTKRWGEGELLKPSETTIFVLSFSLGLLQRLSPFFVGVLEIIFVPFVNMYSWSFLAHQECYPKRKCYFCFSGANNNNRSPSRNAEIGSGHAGEQLQSLSSPLPSALAIFFVSKESVGGCKRVLLRQREKANKKKTKKGRAGSEMERKKFCKCSAASYSYSFRF